MMLKTKTIQIILLVFVGGVFLFSSCKDGKKSKPGKDIKSEIQSKEKSDSTIEKELLVGSWIDCSPAVLHFTLFEDGTARSDNMKTLLYKKWRVKGSQIVFTIESIGNKTSSVDDETYNIEKLTKDSLVLRRGEYLSKYIKK